jgi:hypothetical protein
MDYQILLILAFMAFCLYGVALIIKDKDNK